MQAAHWQNIHNVTMMFDTKLCFRIPSMYIHACTSCSFIALFLRVTINCASGCWHSKFIASIFVTDIYLNQVAVQQHMKEICYSETKEPSVWNAWTHSSQQLAALLECFCAKLLGDCKEFYIRTSKQRTLWERVFCRLFGGCPYFGGSVV